MIKPNTLFLPTLVAVCAATSSLEETGRVAQGRSPAPIVGRQRRA